MADLFSPAPDPPGFVHRPWWDTAVQRAAVGAIRAVADAAPLYQRRACRARQALLRPDDQLRRARLGLRPRRRLPLPADPSR